MLSMWLARLICTDDGCAVEHEVSAPSLAELEVLACSCGCALHVVGFADHVD